MEFANSNLNRKHAGFSKNWKSQSMLKEKTIPTPPPLSSNQIRLHKNTNLKSFSKFNMYKHHNSFLIKYKQNNIILSIHTCDLKINLIDFLFQYKISYLRWKKVPKFYN